MARDYCTACGEDIRRVESGWTHTGDQWNTAEALNSHHSVAAIQDYGVEVA